MAKEGKGAFHVTIVDNETGRVLVDEKATVIIGAVAPYGKDKGIGVTCVHGSMEEILSTIKASREAADEALSRLLDEALSRLPDEAQVVDLLDRLISLNKRGEEERNA